MTRGRRGGFTLMELVVVIGVTAVIATMGYRTFATLIDLRSGIRGAIAETERAIALRETLRDWLNHGLVSVGSSSELPDGTGPQIPTSQGTFANDRITMVTRALTPSRAWGTMLRLFIDNDPATPERGLTIRYLPVPSYTQDITELALIRNAVNGMLGLDEPESKDERARRLSMRPVTRELDSRVVGLRVEYLDWDTRRWVPAHKYMSDIARAVRITLQGAPGAPLPPLLRLPITVVLPLQLTLYRS